MHWHCPELAQVMIICFYGDGDVLEAVLSEHGIVSCVTRGSAHFLESDLQSVQRIENPNFSIGKFMFKDKLLANEIKKKRLNWPLFCNRR